MTQFRKRAITWIAVVMAAAVLLGLAGLYGLTGARQAFAATTADDAVIFEDFEDAEITDANDRKTVSSNIYAPSTVNISIVGEETGNKALQFMFAPAAATDDLAVSDTRALIIEKTDAVPWASYVVSFYVKKASSLDSTFRVRSGLPSNNYGEHRAINTAGTDENGRPPMAADSADKGMLVTQVIPCDPWGTLRISIYPTVAAEGAGIIIDDILVEPYSVAPAGAENELLNPGFYGEWRDVGGTWQWVFDNWMQPTAGAAFNGNWDPWCLSDGFSGYLGTDNGNPTQLTQNVTLEPNTEYNFSIWVKKAYTALLQVPHAQDVFSVKLVSGDTVVSKVDFQADMIGQDAFEQYVKLGGVLKTGEATDYTFVLEYDVPDPATSGVAMSWRVMQLDDVALYKADARTELDYNEASKTENVTVVDDAFSEIEGDQILQADISQGDAKIAFPLTVESNKTYRAYVDAQKLPGANAVLNMVKPMNVRFSVETAVDGTGTTLAELTDTRKISKAIETLELVFNSGDNTQLYLVVTVDGLESEDQYILNNCLIGFKNFSCQKYELTSISASEDLDLLVDETETIRVTAHYEGGLDIDVTDEAEIVSTNTEAVTIENGVLTAVGIGESTINISFNEKTTSFQVSVDRILGFEAGEDRNIRLNETGKLTVETTYESAGEVDVTAQAEVVITDPAVVSYESGTFTALKVGSTQVTVNFRGQQDTFTITVPKEAVSISVPDELTVPAGSTVDIIASAAFNDQTTADVSETATMTVTAGDTFATIEGNTITGVAEGSATVTVTYEQQSATISVRVTKAVTAIDAGEDRKIAMGTTAPLSITATLEDQSTDSATPASAVVTIEDDAIVSYADGVFTPLQAGETNVTVTYGGQTDTFKITVYVKTLTSIEITNGDFTLEFGKTAELEVIGHYNDGDEAPVNALFGIRSGSAVTVENGVVTAVRGGTAVVEASFGGQSATITVTVPKTVTGVSLGNAFELAVGENRTLSLTVTYNDGTTETVTEGITLSSKDDKLTVSGLTVTAAKAGEGQISATYEGLTATVAVTVTNPVRGITVEAGAAKAGDPVTLTVKVKYADGSEQTITEGYTVTSSDAAIVSADGTSVRAEAAGTATLTVSYGGQSATVNVTVEEGGCGSALDAAWPALCIVLIVAAAACIIIQRKKA